MPEPAICPYCKAAGSKTLLGEQAFAGTTRFDFNCGSKALAWIYSPRVRFYLSSRCYWRVMDKKKVGVAA